MFTDNAFRQAWLRQAGADGGSSLDYGAAVESALDALADGVEQALDIDALLACATAPLTAPTGSA